MQATTPWDEGEQRTNRLVFIGRNLREDVLKETFTELAARGAVSGGGSLAS